MRAPTWYRRRLLVALAAGALVTLGGCGDDDGDGDADLPAGDDGGAVDDGDGDGGDGAGSSAGAITISGFAFEGATVAAGATVSVTNEDSTTHTVTSVDDAFDVSVAGGEMAEITAPAEPGSYEYRCEIHTSMTGTLVVE